MLLFDSAFGVISAFFVFVLGAVLAASVSRYFCVPAKKSLGLYFWHTLFCFVYLYYIAHAGGDALMYYGASVRLDEPFAVGTVAVIYFVSLFSDHLGLSLLGTFLVFNIIGFVGLLAVYASLRAVTFGKPIWVRRLALLVVLLPSVSFWSSAIGKDAIAFLATGLALWAAVDFRRRLTLMVPAVLLMFLVRPHMAGMLVIALSVALMLHPRARAFQRLFFGAATIAVAVLLIPFALEYAGLENPSASNLIDYIEKRQTYNLHGGGAVDISSMSFPMQLFTYLFRPVPFEVDSVPQLAASLDNMVLLFLFVVGARAMLKGRRSPLNDDRVFLWVYSLLAWIMLAKVTANLGIAVRQKWMFTPMLYFLLISVIGRVPATYRKPAPFASDKPQEYLPVSEYSLGGWYRRRGYSHPPPP